VGSACSQVGAEIIKHLFANRPDAVYDAGEIDLKANAVFAHIIVSGSATGARVYH
jgi:type I restriction enzyme, R subunit